MPLLQIFSMANTYFNTIRENKIFAKISEFTVIHVLEFLVVDQLYFFTTLTGCRKISKHNRLQIHVCILSIWFKHIYHMTSRLGVK